MKQKLQTLLFALVAMMMPIGVSALVHTVELPSGIGVTTLYLPFDVQLDADTKAYVVTDVTINEDGSVQLVEEELTDGNIPAFTAVIIRNEMKATATTLNVISDLEPFIAEENNLLKGTLVPMSLDVSPETGNFALYWDVLADSEWPNLTDRQADWQAHPNNGSWTYTLQANKAYLQLPVESWSSKLAELKALPHLQHTHGRCEICGQVTEVSWGATADALTSYGTLDDAVAAGKEDSDIGYIKLLADVKNDIYVEGGNFTLDLNGHTISNERHTLYIQNQSNVTIEDNSETKSGKVISSGKGSFAVCVDNGASVTINGGTYESTLHYALNVQGNNSSVTINGGSYNTASKPVVIGEDCSATITGGTFEYTSNGAIENYGNLVVEGGTFTYDGDVDPDSYYTTINHLCGSIDLSNYPTDAINSIDVTNSSGEDITPGAETILLPEGYCFFDYSNDTPVTVLVYGTYYIDVEPAKYTIAFDAGDGEGEMEGEIIYEGDYTLPECTFTAPEGLGFKAWQVGETEYQPGDDVTIDDNTTITALWVTLLEVSFDANGGTGSMDDIFTIADCTLPECTFTAPEGMMFKAWLVGEDEYQPGDDVTIEDNTTITALWTEFVPQIVIDMSDSYGDGWNGASITVKKDGEELGTATVEEDFDANTVTFTYDPTCEYTFYWTKGYYDDECSFEIYVEGELEFAATTDGCAGFENNQQFHTIAVKVSIADDDHEAFSVEEDIENIDITYTRTLPNQEWNSLYVPFEIEVTDELLEGYEVAYANNLHAYDRNDDGAIDDLEMEIIKIKQGTLHANHPYFIRAKSDAAKKMELVMQDVTLYNTVENSMTCQSFYTQFTLTGIYSRMEAADFTEIPGTHYAISTEGGWWQTEGLNPFRVYLTIVDRGESPVKIDEAAFSRVRIRAAGESTTSIDEEQLTIDNKEAIYDLMGRRVMTPQKDAIYIVNGKKVVW